MDINRCTRATLVHALKLDILLNGSTLIKVSGYSMVPLINPNDLVLVQSLGRKLKLGEVVLFYDGERLITHRIVRIIDENLIQTKGDNNLFLDPIIPMENVLGVCKLGLMRVKKIERFTLQLISKLSILAAFFKYMSNKYKHIKTSRYLFLNAAKKARHMLSAILKIVYGEE